MKTSYLHTFLLSYLILSAGVVHADVSLKGTGSVLTAPLIAKWAEGYRSLQPKVRIKYEVKNSADGIRQWMDRGAEFAATDSPLTDEEERRTLARKPIHLPAAIQAVAITYNLPGVADGLKLSPGVLSNIYRGIVKKWNDPSLAELNPGTLLPNMEILVVDREEESAVRDLFPAFLSRLDPQWTAKREKEKDLKWPVGQKVKGNEKALERLRKWPGVIAALDYSFTAANHLPAARIRNAAGQFVGPSVASMQEAASDWVALPEDMKINLHRSRSAKAYPLCGFAWILIYQENFKATHDHARSQALLGFLDWALTEGQRKAEDVFFAPLPAPFQAQVRERIQKVQY